MFDEIFSPQCGHRLVDDCMVVATFRAETIFCFLDNSSFSEFTETFDEIVSLYPNAHPIPPSKDDIVKKKKPPMFFIILFNNTILLAVVADAFWIPVYASPPYLACSSRPPMGIQKQLIANTKDNPATDMKILDKIDLFMISSKIKKVRS